MTLDAECCREIAAGGSSYRRDSIGAYKEPEDGAGFTHTRNRFAADRQCNWVLILNPKRLVKFHMRMKGFLHGTISVKSWHSLLFPVAVVPCWSRAVRRSPIMTKNRTADSRPSNKLARQNLYHKLKKAQESQKRDFRLRRKREEAKDPRLRLKRQQKNVPVTIDKKRTWDEIDDADEGGTGIGKAVDVGALKRRRLDHEILDRAEGRGKTMEREGLTEDKLKEKEELDQQVNGKGADQDGETRAELGEDQNANGMGANGTADGASLEHESAENDKNSEADDLESIIASSSAASDDNDNGPDNASDHPSTATQKTNTPSTTSTALSLIPDALAQKFPTLFAAPTADPKILVTTSLNFSNHEAATQFADFFPSSQYVPRMRHKYKSHRYSLRDISKYASNRGFTTLLVLTEDHKRPHALTAIHLPSGPTLHFSITNWIPGKIIPGHGKATDHHPELILNNFRTPLGLLTAHFFRSLFPLRPELGGRQVVTLHNQRDYIFARRHRYIFRERRETEKKVSDPETGQSVKGMEEVKAGLQELGPRFTLKLRRVDRGIQRASGQEWEWKGRMEKARSRFQL